jgi:PAS domain S-box-containing protein
VGVRLTHPSRKIFLSDRPETPVPTVRELFARKDWSKVPIGQPDAWPASLKTVVGLMLGSRFPMFIAWGPQLTFLYNDAYAPILGAKHPGAFGAGFQDVWSEIWQDIGPLAERALAGEATWLEDLPLVMRRHGYDEETWFTFSYSPAFDDSGAIAGVFCACTETTEKVLAVRRNAAERHRLEQLFGEAPAFMALLSGPDHVFELANKAYMQLVGYREILGKTARAALPEVEGQGFFQLLDGVYQSGEPFVGRQVPLQVQRTAGSEPEQAYVDFVYQPIRDSAGTVTGIFVTGYDVTDLHIAQDRLRIAQQAGGIGSFELYPASRTVSVSEEFCHIWGVPVTSTASVNDLFESVHPDDRERVLTGGAEIDGESLGYIEYRIIRRDNGKVRWIARRGEAIFDASSDVGRLAGVIYDITDRRLAEEALASHARNLETLNRTGAALAGDLDISSIVQRVTDAGVELIGADFGAFFYNVTDREGERLTLYTLAGADRSQFEDFGHPRPTDVFRPTFEGTAIVRSDDITKDPRYGNNSPYFGMPKNHLPVRSYLAVPVKSRGGEVIGGLFFGNKNPGVFTHAHEELINGIASQAAIAFDNARLYQEAQFEIERRRRAEEHQQLLINELNHRVKNTLAIVQSLAQQSFGKGKPADVARNAFEARLQALSTAHNLLTRKNWEEASLSDIIATAVGAAAGAAAEQVSLNGPEVILPPQTAVSVAMAVHELSTNALKYGALSVAEGSISVSWNVEANDAGGDPRLHVQWKEAGGPAVVPPEGRGFGSRMIERGLASELQGTVELKFESDGVRCTIDAPLPKE